MAICHSDPVRSAARRCRRDTRSAARSRAAQRPGRFLYAGLRDFFLGVQFVDGDASLLRMGGKVVKNAAGFDLPKSFVGSLGRCGVLAEIAFKVFRRAATFRTRKSTA